MMRRLSRRYELWDVPAVSREGEVTRAYLGGVEAVLTSRSAKESTQRQEDCAAETLSALIGARFAPPGGFCRGMTLVAPDGAVYRMLTPVPLGRMWTVKCVRMHV